MREDKSNAEEQLLKHQNLTNGIERAAEMLPFFF